MRSPSVKAKLIISLAIPTLFICAFIAVYIGQSIKSARDADDAIVVIQQSMSINVLVHDIQAERDISASLLVANHEDLKQQLFTLRQQTDQKLRIFSQLIAGNIPLQRLAQHNNVVNQLSRITLIREAVDTGDSVPFEHYTELVADNLNFISAIQEQVTDSDLLLNMDFYIPLIWFKEFASLERGSFHRIYNSPRFSQVALAQLLGLRDKQELIFCNCSVSFRVH